MEAFKDIKGYKGLYMVGANGTIISLPKLKGFLVEGVTIKSPFLSNGYLRVKLHKDGKSKNYFVHRLVAEAFIPNHDKDKTQIDHINGIKNDNRVENLRWCTPKQNSNFPLCLEKRREASSRFNHDEKVLQKKRRTTCCKRVGMYLDDILVNVFFSAKEAHRILGYSVSAMCRGVYKTKYKNNPYTFRYISPESYKEFMHPDRDALLIAEYARRKNL